MLADDHATVRQGLRLLIDGQPDMTVVAEAGDGQSAIAAVEQFQPDVVVMDISMPGVNGLNATRMLKEMHSESRVVALTRYSDDAYLQELLRAGVAGYVLKQSASIELLQAIRAAAAGGQYLDSTVTGRVTDGFLARDGRKARQAQPSLTDREVGGAPADRQGLQQQGDRRTAGPQRQDRRGSQGERDAQARVSRANRHRPLRNPAGLDARWVEIGRFSPEHPRCFP